MKNVESQEELTCEYEGNSDTLREELLKLLKPEDRIDKLILKKYEKSKAGNFPNRKITIIFYSKDTRKVETVND